MRRCPQRGFCLASRRTSSRISSGTGGRPAALNERDVEGTRRCAGPTGGAPGPDPRAARPPEALPGLDVPIRDKTRCG